MKKKISLRYLILLLLALKDRKGQTKIESRTRLTKMLFLISKELENRGYEIPDIDLEINRIDHFSSRIYKHIKSFEANGVVEIRRKGERTEFDIAERKRREIRESLKNVRNKYRDAIEIVKKVKERFNDIPLDILLAYVYLKYPEYATEPKIKEKVIETVFREINRFREEAEKCVKWNKV